MYDTRPCTDCGKPYTIRDMRYIGAADFDDERCWPEINIIHLCCDCFNDRKDILKQSKKDV